MSLFDNHIKLETQGPHGNSTQFYPENNVIMAQAIHSSNTPYPSMAFLFDALIAPVKLAVLETAVELDLGHILKSAGNVDDIANKAGIQADTIGLTHFLDAMVALGLANKENNTYD